MFHKLDLLQKKRCLKNTKISKRINIKLNIYEGVSGEVSNRWVMGVKIKLERVIAEKYLKEGINDEVLRLNNRLDKLALYLQKRGVFE